MAEINVEKKSNPWPWIIGLIVLALLAWAAFAAFNDGNLADDTAYVGNDTEVIAPVAADGSDAGANIDQAPVAMGTTRVYFPLDHAVLTDDARAELDQIVQEARGEADHEIVLAAYTDTTGTRPYNEALSERRGEAVRQYLIAQGIEADRISVEPHGQTDELVETADGVIAQANRRVTIEFGDEI